MVHNGSPLRFADGSAIGLSAPDACGRAAVGDVAEINTKLHFVCSPPDSVAVFFSRA
jgi:hypothetical protein